MIGLREIDKRLFRELKRRVRAALGLRNTFGDRVVLEDYVEAWMGDKRVVSSKGHIVNQGLIELINLMAVGGIPTDGVPSVGWTDISRGRMRVGTGTGVTVGTMTSLVNENTTNPNSQTGATASPSVGTYRISWIATWNAGTLPAIDVSEMGLYLYMVPTLKNFGDAMGTPTAFTLFSRLSDSDGDFTTFTVNTAVPLTIEWRLTLTFA